MPFSIAREYKLNRSSEALPYQDPETEDIPTNYSIFPCHILIASFPASGHSVPENKRQKFGAFILWACLLNDPKWVIKSLLLGHRLQRVKVNL